MAGELEHGFVCLQHGKAISTVFFRILHPSSHSSEVNPGSTPAGTNTSYWWQQEGYLTNTAPVHQQKPNLSW